MAKPIFQFISKTNCSVMYRKGIGGGRDRQNSASSLAALHATSHIGMHTELNRHKLCSVSMEIKDHIKWQL